MKNILFNIALLGTTSAKVSLGSLCLEEPCYGTSATAIERIDDNQPKYICIMIYENVIFSLPIFQAPGTML